LGMFWKRMSATAGWVGLVGGTLSAVVVFVLAETGVLDLPGQGAAFLAASTAFVVDIVLSVIVTYRTAPKPAHALSGLVYSETPKDDFEDIGEPKQPDWKRTVKIAGVAMIMFIIL